ncbi:MAG: hypothetical protein IPK18_07900 [Sphingobacteriales bacterium]|nr:MAG: hypothetical protein IPK18_07900 [Sphingobacteriales bacterium]
MERIKNSKTINLIAIILIIVLGIIITYNLENYMDVLLWDEARYLDRGLWLWHAYPKNSSPLYSVWYKILSLFNDNRVELYYLNFKVLSITTAVLAYLFLIVYRTPKSIAFFFASMWLYSAYNLPVWPKVSHFAIILFFIATIAVNYISSKVDQLLVFSAALLLASFARPELYVAFVLFVIFSIIYIYTYKIKISKGNAYPILAFILLFCVIYFLYKTPFTSGDTSRGSFAFVQHFAHNYAIWTKEHFVFWYEWPEILQKCFPPPYNLKNIILNTESYFWKHVFFNLSELGKNIVTIFASILLPIEFVCSKKIFFITSVLALVFIIYKSKFNNIKNRFIQHHLLVFFLLIGIIPVVLSSIYAYPRMHYMVMLFPTSLFIIAMLFDKIELKNDAYFILIIFCLFAVFAAKSKDFKYFDMFGSNKGRMNQKTIQYLEKKYKNDSIKILDVEGGLSTMMTQNFTSINPNQIFQDSSIHFSDVISKEQPDIIYVTPILLRLKKIKSDTVFQKMLLKPENYNYFRQKTSIFGVYLFEHKATQ